MYTVSMNARLFFSVPTSDPREGSSNVHVVVVPAVVTRSKHNMGMVKLIRASILYKATSAIKKNRGKVPSFVFIEG